MPTPSPSSGISAGGKLAARSNGNCGEKPEAKSSSGLVSGRTTNTSIKAEIDEAQRRLEHVAQNFSVEWKNFLAYAMQTKQTAATDEDGSDAAIKGGTLEDLLLQSQSGLVMLREMKLRRVTKWREVTKTHGYHPLDDDTRGSGPVEAAVPHSSRKQATITTRLIAHSSEKARLSRLVLSRTRSEPGAPHQELHHHHAAVKALTEATRTQHRLSHSVGLSVDTRRQDSKHHSLHVVQPEDMESFIRFTHAKLTVSLPFERFFLRIKWLCTSHRYHVRQRQLTLFHQQKAKNAPMSTVSMVEKLKNLSTSLTASGQGVVHCPLFVLSAIQLEAELSRHLPRHAGVDCLGANGFNVVALKVQVDQQLTESLKICTVDGDLSSEDHPVEPKSPDLPSFFTQSRFESHWEIRQLDILESHQHSRASGLAGGLNSAASNEFDDDPLLRNEWELLSLKDSAYMRIRVEALARSHFGHAQVDLTSTVLVALPSSSRQGDKSKVIDRASRQEDQLVHLVADAADDELLCSETIAMLYTLRIVSCRAKRLQLLRLLNYFHYVVLSRRAPENGSYTDSSLRMTSERRRSSLTTHQQTVATHWHVEKRQDDFVILENKRRSIGSSDAGDGATADDGDVSDDEFIFPAAREDLAIVERHLLRIASVFVRRQERASLPSLNDPLSSTPPMSTGAHVMAIDRMQVLCDVYDCELGFMQAKLQLVQLLLQNGLGFTHDADPNGSNEPSATCTDTVLSVLRHRPLIDFSHAYFYESYTVETLHLELQTSLQQQLHDHFTSCEAQSDVKDDWIERQLIRTSLVTRLHHHQQALLKEAEHRWFCVAAVSELHALRQAIYEQLLITWKLICSVELAVDTAQCLERTGDTILRGRGWQVVFPVKLLQDCCQNFQLTTITRLDGTKTQVRDSSSVDAMVQALRVLERHQELGQQVYEASLLERVYRFQYDIVAQKDASDKVSAFFFSGSSDLVTVALELLGDKEFANLTSKTASGVSKTVPEWLEAQLTSSSELQDNLEDADWDRNVHWQALFLDFQKRWTRFLGDAVRYQDLIGAEISEFASCSPFLFLENAAASRHRGVASSSSSEAATVNSKAVQGKYADEIAEKMKDEMQQNCYPYWLSLAQLKGQLKKRFTNGGTDGKNSDSRTPFAATAFEIPLVDNDKMQGSDGSLIASDALMQSYALRFDACAQYMATEAAVPRHLVRVNWLLKRFRNEQALMQNQCDFSACAFTPNRFSEEHDSCKKNTLTRWLTSKLEQLHLDLQLHSSATNRRSLHDTIQDPVPAGKAGEVVEENQLLLSLPSQLYLIDQFAVPLCRDQLSPALSKAAMLTNDERVATLRSLCAILETFHTGMDLIRVKSSFYFAMKRFKSSPAVASGRASGRQSTAKNSMKGQSYTSHGLLERWQTHLHNEIRAFHDRILNQLLHSHALVATCNIYARNNDNKVKLANKSQYEALQVIQTSVNASTRELTGFLQCVTSFLLIQTVGNKHFDETEVDAGADPLVANAQLRKHLQHCLLSLTTRLQANQSVLQQSEDGGDDEIMNRSMVSPVASSASEMFRLFFRSSHVATTASRSEREVIAFWLELVRHQQDAAYVGTLTNWLDLQRVYVVERMRPSLPPLAHPDGSFVLTAASLEQEVAAVAALDKLWERYELITSEDEYVEPINLGADAGAEANLNYQTNCQPPVLVRRESRRVVHHQASFAQRRGLAVPYLPSSSACASMLLPSQRKLRHQIEFLHLHFELQWLQADIMQMEHHYASFLDQKKKSQSQLSNGAKQSSNQFHHRRKTDVHSPALLLLSKFYRNSDDGIDRAGGDGDSNRSHVTQGCGEFVIPASEMNILLQDLAGECTQHHLKQTEASNQTITSLQRQLAAAQHSLASLQHESKRDHRQEALKRESYAIDHTYQLHFQMALLKKQVEATENRMDLERLALQCQLSNEYEKKLAAMHAQLLTKQQRFDEYRVVMQHDLHVQLQGAQTQLVHQLVDHSGSISVEMKASFLANLHGQHADDHVHKENVALKQTLLKLQSLLEMQQQTHGANQEREQMLHRRHKTSNLMLRNEAAQLQQQIQQLEADMSKLSQEKTAYMLKWNSLQKQTESAAQKKREAKIRALSAPFHRGVAAAISPFPSMEEHGDVSEPVVSIGSGLESSQKSRSRALRSFDDEEEAFERYHELAIRQQGPHSLTAEEMSTGNPNEQRSEKHFQSSARHYQNEIRRLQQQLARESKSKAALIDQVVQLRAQLPAEADNQALEGDDVDANPEAQSSSSTTKEATRASSSRANGGGFMLMSSNLSGGGVRVPSASFGRMLTPPSSSSRLRAQSASICTPARPQQQSPAASGSEANKRPSTSFSPRAPSLYRTSVAAPGIASPRSSGLPLPSTSSVAGPGTRSRKFEVQKRSEPKIGGVAGVPNALCVRETLPYR